MNAKTADLIPFFKGMARRDAAVVLDAAAFDGWQSLAAKLLQQKREDILRSLPDEDLLAVASGEIDIAQAARAALAQA